MEGKLTVSLILLAMLNCTGCTIIYEYGVDGKIVDSQSGEPIVGATIALDSPTSSEPLVATTDSTGNFSHVFAHSDGDYIGGKLRSGRARTITIEHAEYGSVRIEVSPSLKPKHVKGNEVRVIAALSRSVGLGR